MEEVAYEFNRNQGEVVRASFSDFTGKTRADLRIFYQAKDGGWRPTKKGINLNLDLIPKMRKALEILEKKSKEIQKVDVNSSSSV